MSELQRTVPEFRADTLRHRACVMVTPTLPRMPHRCKGGMKKPFMPAAYGVRGAFNLKLNAVNIGIEGENDGGRGR